MTPSVFLSPALAQVGLTLVVLLWLYAKRIPAMNAAKVDPETLQRKDPEIAAKMPASTHYPADNFINLFEVPMLFLALCFIMHMTGYDDSTTAKMAWGFVFLRAIHSIIQCTYNKVMHRFTVYAISSLLLMAIFVRFSLAYMA